MTEQIFFPDISNVGNKGLILEPKTVAVTAKASEGSSFTDPSFIGFKVQADAQGSVFDCYHWLWPGNEDAQAGHVLSIVGPTIPIMIDAENDVTGAYLTVPGICAFVDAVRRKGGITRKLYLPHWYWRDRMGSPSLAPLVTRGMLLVASEYRTYDANNWPEPYGGFASVFQWQYTSSLKYGNQPKVDFNAVRMSVTDYAKAIGYGSAPTPPAPPKPIGDDMLTHWVTVKEGDKGDGVKVAQGILKARGFNIGPSGIDGDFGGFTLGATRALQARYLPSQFVDGEFGPQTLSVGLFGHDYTR